jgi:hypothetical protein
MPQNKIQFQHGVSLSEFTDTYGTEVECKVVLERARWPTGFACPGCGEREHSCFLADGWRYWQCVCAAEPSRRRAPVPCFMPPSLPLTKWFQARSAWSPRIKKTISSLSLKPHLGVAYATTWRVKHKLLKAMRQRASKRLLRGVVMADGAILGGEHADKPGRSPENKVPFMAAVEFDDERHPPGVRFDAIDDLKDTTLATWAKSALDPKVHL